MKIPIFQKLDSIISECEVLIKEYQLIEQQIDKSQSSIFRLFRVNVWKRNYQKLLTANCKIDTNLNQLKAFYNSNKNKFSDQTNLYIKEYIKYFESVSYAINLRVKIQKNVIDDLSLEFIEQEEEIVLNSRLEDLNEMTEALKECEKKAYSVNEIVENMRNG